MFRHIPSYPGDSVLSLNQDFLADTRQPKVNLGIGMYFDESGRIPIMRAVRKIEEEIGTAVESHPYLPMTGLGAYCEQAKRVVFGSDLYTRLGDRIATIQTLGGSGALKVGADFLKHHFPESQLWVSDPTWDNHKVLFGGAGIKVNPYPYYDARTGGLRFAEMLEVLGRVPLGNIVLLHACCHNPTGVDMNAGQWSELLSVLLARRLVAFVDMAYQGFGSGLEEDASSVRMLAEAGVPLLVANSFSKNFSLYSERCGALSVLCADAEEADRIHGQLAAEVRTNYSSPPKYGAAIVTRILSDQALRAEWAGELRGMRERMLAMRAALHARLAGKIDEVQRARYVNQRGMFTYTGLSNDQVARLKNEFSIYLVGSGRMCVAGLSDNNVEYVASAIAAVSGR